MADRFGVDQAAILSRIFDRNAIRRQALLPPLNIRAVFEHEVETARWRAICDAHYAHVRAEVLARLRERHGLDFGNSAGGRWAVEFRTRRALHERFWL
ncbi:hypothetical protein [Methylobacterium radiodurans]|uniref:Uncharacterized protein n=1 Tax=Methylobacterium radiodurans TaxID=2202828 RepID=A0A2U8VP78_9HYPH|nr:hypothetical protein [Methylobacterium radiodurans]AWN35424.1 hypothetical protein DK427_06520 [Methylobacterium radiodurans]